MIVRYARSLSALVAAASISAAAVAQAEEYRLLPSEPGTCQQGEKSDWMVLEGPHDVSVARAHGDTVNTAICVDDDKKQAVNIRWKANGYWKTSGTVSHGCAEILGASKVKVRAVNTNFHETATYYSCVKE